MPNERVSMSKLKQLIGLQASNLSVRALARALGLSVGAVSKYLRAVRGCGIGAAEAESLSESELEQRVFGPAPPGKPGALVPPDCAWIHTELKRHRHVTLQLLWEEYRERYGAEAYRRSAFCQIYRRWEKRLKRSMRQRHFAGEKLFIDYAGRTVPIYGAHGEEAFQAQLFVSALGASGLAYAEGTRTQALADWLASHVRALEYYGAAPTIFVPDNPKVGVTRADRYEPELQRSYEELAAHYRAVVIPARPYRPKDKSRAELTVLLVCRWILARLRHQRFYSVEELNAAIRPLLIELNERPFQRLPGSRRSVFEALDRPAMRPLPASPYVYAEWKERTVAFDYHVDVDRHYYSVPHALVGHSVWARYTAATVEIFFRSARVATHIRSYQRGAHTTVPEHMPKSHRAHAEWSPKRLIQWGESIGAHTGAIVEHLLRTKPHPEQGYRACLGLLALARQYGEARLEAASALAVRLGSPTRKSVKSILESGRDRHLSSTTEPLALELPLHGNVRGPGYYH
ncbi:MAG: IS21 family transposase [Gammaproteobacteria bacterium]|nr:MAG: IS21 family transposase [Gammaproteobacteria bacterium]